MSSLFRSMMGAFSGSSNDDSGFVVVDAAARSGSDAGLPVASPVDPSPPAAVAVDLSTNSLTLEVTPLYPTIGIRCPPSDREKFYYVATLTACELLSESARAPVDVVVSLDISGSMSGEKLSMCKRTIEALINELKDSDKLSIVSFSDEARVELPLSAMTKANKDHAKGVVTKLQTEGSTNISGGLTSAIQQITNVARGQASGNVRSILLLTDGHANRGVSDPVGLVNLARGCLAALPDVSVNCFGYGSDHNADLLKKLSECSTTKGSYYFVENYDNVSSAFGDCIGGLMSVAAQNIRLSFKGENIKVLHDSAVRNPDGSFSVVLGDMFAEESKDIVVEVSPLPSAPGAISLSVAVSYVDIFRSRVVPEASPCMRLNVAAAISGADELARKGDVDGARARIQLQRRFVSSGLPAATDATRQQMEGFDRDLNLVEKGLVSREAYAREGSKVCATKMQMHSAQRCNESDEMESCAYRGSAKSATASRMKSHASPLPTSKVEPPSKGGVFSKGGGFF